MRDPYAGDRPGPRRRATRGFRLAYGRATSRRRVLPAAIIIGAQKAGTSALFDHLRRHPAVVARSKEVHYFDRHSDAPVARYRAHFPTAGSLRRAQPRGAITFEATPYYLFHPLVPHRVRGLIPRVKLLAVLRDPVERAISHYNHEVKLGVEDLSLEEAIEREPERLRRELELIYERPLERRHNHEHYSYLARGRYAEQLERWLSVFEPAQLLVVDSAELRHDPAPALAQVCAFLGLAEVDLGPAAVVNAQTYGEVPAQVSARLHEYFAPHNERLFELLGRELWQRNPPPGGGRPGGPA